MNNKYKTTILNGRIFARILNIFFPISCAGCNTPLPAEDHYRVCPSCLEKIPFITGLVCVQCGEPLPDGGATCYACRHRTLRHITAIRSCVPYEGIARDFLKKFKYGNRDYLDRFLGRLLVAGFETHRRLFEDCDIVVPVPLHPLRRLMRGYNQAELLAHVLAVHIRKPVVSNVLRRVAYSRPQFRLGREERFENLKNVFSARKTALLNGKNILLIDDICTTGATLSYCAAALRRTGAARVYGLTIARD